MILNCFGWSDIVKRYINIIIRLTEPRPTEPLQSHTQAPQAWGKKKGPPEVMPPQAIPHKTRDPGPPSGQLPPRVKGRGVQLQHVVERAGTAPGVGGVKGPVPYQEVSLVAPGGKGPRGATPQPPSQTPSSSPAPTGKITSNCGTFKPTLCQMFQLLVVLFLKILFISLELCMHKYCSKHCLLV